MDVDLTGVFDDDDDFEEGGKVIILNTITYNVCGNLSKKKCGKFHTWGGVWTGSLLKKMSFSSKFLNYYLINHQ